MDGLEKVKRETTMLNVWFDRKMADDERRAAIYAGDLFVYSPGETVLRLCGVAREMLEGAFAGHDPREAQHHLPVQEFARILRRGQAALHSRPALQGAHRPTADGAGLRSSSALTSTCPDCAARRAAAI